MTKYLLLFSTVVLLSVMTDRSFSCSNPKPGYGYAAEELIDNSVNIVLAELMSTKKILWGEESYKYIHKLKPIEVIKGKFGGFIEFTSYSNYHEPYNFIDHKEELFWEFDIGRTKFKGGLCGPDHTFKKGYKYLIFPEYFGANKSAEIVKSRNDSWYKYVLQKANINS